MQRLRMVTWLDVSAVAGHHAMPAALLFVQCTLGAGADNSNRVNFEHHRKLLSLNICCKFQKDCFEVSFYTDFFTFLYMYIAPGQGQITSDAKISMLI